IAPAIPLSVVKPLQGDVRQPHRFQLHGVALLCVLTAPARCLSSRRRPARPGDQQRNDTTFWSRVNRPETEFEPRELKTVLKIVADWPYRILELDVNKRCMYEGGLTWRCCPPESVGCPSFQSQT